MFQQPFAVERARNAGPKALRRPPPKFPPGKTPETYTPAEDPIKLPNKISSTTTVKNT